MTVTFNVDSYLSRFDVSPMRGFLPEKDPQILDDSWLNPWDSIAREMPHLLAAGTFRNWIDQMPLAWFEQIARSDPEWAMRWLSFFAHGYVWGAPGEKPIAKIPQSVAVPLCYVAKKLGRPPALSYASYVLQNWRPLVLSYDRSRYLNLEKIAVIQGFLGGVDEQWFIMVHVAIEQAAAPGLMALAEAKDAIAHGDDDRLAELLHSAAAYMHMMAAILKKMPERCDPRIYYHRVRPYLYGWGLHTPLPQGVVYEGVDEFSGEPQAFRGETGAQSSVIPVYVAALGIQYGEDALVQHTKDMLRYMPVGHRAFVEEMGGGASIRKYVLARRDNQWLLNAYNHCVCNVARFLEQHYKFAVEYIHKPSGEKERGGTGGTQYLEYLRSHYKEVELHII